MEVRTIVAFGVGVVSGAAGSWAMARRSAPGQIFEIEGTFYVQAAVMNAVASRAARVKTKTRTVEMLLVGLHRRGVLTFRLAEFWVDAPRYGKLYLVSMQVSEDGLPEWGVPRGQQTPSIRDVLVEFVAYGLARPGLSFASRTAFERGDGRPLNLEVIRDAPREVEVEVEQRRPGGSYFKVGDIYYADSRFLERMEWIPGSQSDERGHDVAVPIWKRGRLKFLAMGQAQVFPEQNGALYRLEPELVGVDLEDLLTELVELGLVGWGGERAAFPAKRIDHRATGTPGWVPAGKILSHDEGEYIDDRTVAQLLTRLESEALESGRIRIHWRSNTIELRPTVGSGRKLYYVGPTGDPGVKALLDELALRRIASRPDELGQPGLSKPALRPTGLGGTVGHVYRAPSGLVFVDGAFAERLIQRARGSTYEADRIVLRFGEPHQSSDYDVIALTPVTRRSGPQLFFLFPVQAGELYDVEFVRMTPAAWQTIVESSARAGHVREVPFPQGPSTEARTGHLYSVSDGSGIFVDGAFLILLRAAANKWDVQLGGKILSFTFGTAVDGRDGGVVLLRALSTRMGAMPGLFPDQAGDLYEVDLTGMKFPEVWSDFVAQNLASRKVVRIELTFPDKGAPS